jgi:hypothetical protein
MISQGDGMRAASSIRSLDPPRGFRTNTKPETLNIEMKKLMERTALFFTVLLLALLALFSCAQAASIKLAWNANPPHENITAYELEAAEVLGMASKRVKVTGGETSVIVTGLSETPHFFRVRAYNAYAVSGWSETVTGVPEQTVRVTLQRSATLTGWQDVQSVRLPKQEREFYRLKVEVEP